MSGIDRAVAAQIMEAVSEHAIEAALLVADQVNKVDNEVMRALTHELQEARYEASLAARRYEAVDPSKRHVARELESRWNTALERVADLEERIATLNWRTDARPAVDRDALITLAHDLPSAWNAPGVQPQTKQRLVRILIQEVVIDISEIANEAVVTVQSSGGRHTELRVARVRVGRYPEDRHPSPVEVVRSLAGHYPDRELAVTMNRMRCKATDGQTWTTVRVRGLRERLGLAAFDPEKPREKTISVDETAKRLGICVGSVHRLIREGVLPASQLMTSAPWQVPVAALDSEPVKIGVRAIVERRPNNFLISKDLRTLKLPGF